MVYSLQLPTYLAYERYLPIRGFRRVLGKGRGPGRGKRQGEWMQVWKRSDRSGGGRPGCRRPLGTGLPREVSSWWELKFVKLFISFGQIHFQRKNLDSEFNWEASTKQTVLRSLSAI